MRSFSVNLPDHASASEVLSNLPADMKETLTGGFKALPLIPSGDHGVLISSVIDSVGPGGLSLRNELETRFKINQEAATALAATLGFLALLMIGDGVTADEVLQAATTAGFLTDATSDAVANLLRSMAEKRALIMDAFDRAGTAAEVLPTLDEFDTTVDLRVHFDKGQVGSVIPVILVHIDTSSYGQEAWFQVTKKQLEAMIEDLQAAKTRAEQAEEWARIAKTTKG